MGDFAETASFASVAGVVTASFADGCSTGAGLHPKIRTTASGVNRFREPEFIQLILSRGRCRETDFDTRFVFRRPIAAC